MVRLDTIAPNDVQILMQLVSGLTARDSLLADPWFGGLADARITLMRRPEALICFDVFSIN